MRPLPHPLEVARRKAFRLLGDAADELRGFAVETIEQRRVLNDALASIQAAKNALDELAGQR